MQLNNFQSESIKSKKIFKTVWKNGSQKPLLEYSLMASYIRTLTPDEYEMYIRTRNVYPTVVKQKRNALKLKSKRVFKAIWQNCREPKDEYWYWAKSLRFEMDTPANAEKFKKRILFYKVYDVEESYIDSDSEIVGYDDLW